MAIEWKKFSVAELKKIYADEKKKREFLAGFREGAPGDGEFLTNLALGLTEGERFDSDTGTLGRTDSRKRGISGRLQS